MTAMRLQRFDMQHLRDFRQPITVNAAVLADPIEAAPPPPPPPPVFSEADIDHARAAASKLGYAEGFEAGLAQAHTEDTARAKDIAAAAARIAEQLAALVAGHQQLITEQASELGQLVMVIARKVAGEALDKHGMETVSALMQRCVPVIFDKPRVTVELSPTLLALAEPVLTASLKESGFEGDIQFRANEQFDSHDMRVDWGAGQATRSGEVLWQEIEALLQHVPLTPTLPATVIESEQ